ncbi:MAG: hypothetical protein LBQ87_10155 [Candidatus Fibromonas sp.]|jgi:hypothetical protein|nr:hypothetical protein [Candidatus Fibromonas sp.]
MPVFLLLFLLLLSCSDNLFYSETTPRISIEVQNRSDTVQVGDTVHFQAKINPSRIDARRCSWIIEDVISDRETVKFPFENHGLYNAKFHVTDFLGDTQSISLFIRVSSPPVCESFSLDSIQGSPIFKWKCESTDPNDSLTYNFTLINKKQKDTTTITLQKDSLMLGYRLPDNWEARLIAANNYGFKDSLIMGDQ